MLEQQGMLASRISELNKQQDSLQEQPDISKITELREAYRDVGRDLLKLLFFVERNAIGLQKILKKFDKPFGYRSTDYYVKTALIIRIPNSSKFSSMWKISVVVTHGYLVVTEQQVPEGVLKGINFSILSETDACSTCGTNNGKKCEGHFGLIKFPYTILNLYFLSEIAQILKKICPGCKSVVVIRSRVLIRHLPANSVMEH